MRPLGLLQLGAKMQAMFESKAAAEAGTHHYMMFERGNDAGEALITIATDTRVDQSRAAKCAVVAREVAAIAFDRSESLDNPSTVLQ